MKPKPLDKLKVSKHQIPACGLIPNTSVQRYPLMIYRSAFPPSCSASSIESYISSIAVVVPQWRYTMYSTTHFHSNTHEVLCIAHGSARLCFGGEENPDRVETVVNKGDVIVVPAGVGHRLLDDLEEGFTMVGTYPIGEQWDMCYGKHGEEKKIEGIQHLGWFKKDPIYGDQGPVLSEGM